MRDKTAYVVLAYDTYEPGCFEVVRVFDSKEPAVEYLNHNYTARTVDPYTTETLTWGAGTTTYVLSAGPMWSEDLDFWR